MRVLSVAVLLVACGSSAPPPPAFPPGSGLNARRYANLQRLAGADLGCAPDALTYAFNGSNFHTMTGCGSSTQYYMHCVGMSCAWMKPPFQEAAFSMNCTTTELSFVVLPGNKLGVSGCNARVVYTPICTNTGWGLGNCSWVQDASQSQMQRQNPPPPPPP